MNNNLRKDVGMVKQRGVVHILYSLDVYVIVVIQQSESWCAAAFSFEPMRFLAWVCSVWLRDFGGIVLRVWVIRGGSSLRNGWSYFHHSAWNRNSDESRRRSRFASFVRNN